MKLWFKQVHTVWNLPCYQANIYLFKTAEETLEKGVKYVQSLQ